MNTSAKGRPQLSFRAPLRTPDRSGATTNEPTALDRSSAAAALSQGRAATRPRLLRFALVGSICALVQLGLLHVLVQGDVQENVANLVAFGISVQANFVLSQFFTWRDRWTRGPGVARLMSRLFLFNGSAASTGAVNQGVFGLGNLVLWYLAAAALGITVAAATNFLLNDRIVFRVRGSRRLLAANARLYRLPHGVEPQRLPPPRAASGRIGLWR